MTTSSQAAIGSEDTRTRYYANGGKVYADDGTEAGTARSANGAELERHARALDDARAQREELDRRRKLAGGMSAELVKPARSHWLELPRGSSSEPFTKEEVHPILRISGVPRAGTVLADFSADRYVHSSSEGERMGPWRIVLRRIRLDATDTPELYTSSEAGGIGEKTRPAVDLAGRELIREWLESDHYNRSRKRAGAAAIVRELKDAAGRGSYAFETVRRYLDAAAPQLDPVDVSAIKTACERIAGELKTLEAIASRDEQ